MPELGERVARIEGELDNIQETVLSIKGYLERSATERTTHHTLVIERLTRSEGKMDSIADNMNKYQATCDADRKNIGERIEGVEKKQTWQNGWAAGVALVVSAGVWMGDKLLGKG